MFGFLNKKKEAPKEEMKLPKEPPKQNTNPKDMPPEVPPFTAKFKNPPENIAPKETTDKPFMSQEIDLGEYFSEGKPTEQDPTGMMQQAQEKTFDIPDFSEEDLNLASEPKEFTDMSTQPNTKGLVQAQALTGITNEEQPNQTQEETPSLDSDMTQQEETSQDDFNFAQDEPAISQDKIQEQETSQEITQEETPSLELDMTRQEEPSQDDFATFKGDKTETQEETPTFNELTTEEELLPEDLDAIPAFSETEEEPEPIQEIEEREEELPAFDDEEETQPEIETQIEPEPKQQTQIEPEIKKEQPILFAKKPKELIPFISKPNYKKIIISFMNSKETLEQLMKEQADYPNIETNLKKHAQEINKDINLIKERLIEIDKQVYT